MTPVYHRIYRESIHGYAQRRTVCAPAAAGGCQRHGHTPQKAMTCAAVPSVLQNGVVVYQNVKNAHELERIPAAAPVTVETPAEKMYTAVMLQRDPQNVAYFLEPGEITSIKRMDTSSPTGGRHAPNIFFRDNVSIYDPSLSQNIQGVNTRVCAAAYGMRTCRGRWMPTAWTYTAEGDDLCSCSVSSPKWCRCLPKCEKCA